MNRVREFFVNAWRGDSFRTSRFRDYAGRPLDLAGFRFLPLSLATTIAFKSFGYRARLPWLGFRAIKAIEQLLTRDSKVLEFGAGMSTLWFSQRCARVTSIETSPEWFARCQGFLTRKRISNVDLLSVPAGPGYPHIEDLAQHSFDFVLVDGIDRLAEMRAALRLVSKGGHIFLDNSDAPTEEHRSARRLLEAAAPNLANIQVFTDLYPGYIGANQGILARIDEPMP
jgi:hypothetical protein